MCSTSTQGKDLSLNVMRHLTDCGVYMSQEICLCSVFSFSFFFLLFHFFGNLKLSETEVKFECILVYHNDIQWQNLELLLLRHSDLSSNQVFFSIIPMILIDAFVQKFQEPKNPLLFVLIIIEMMLTVGFSSFYFL